MGFGDYWDAKNRLEQVGVQSAKALARAGVESWWRQWLREGAQSLTRGVHVSAKRLASVVPLVAHGVSQLAPRGLVGVRSAAALHGLLEAPEQLDLLMPRGAWRTTADWPFACRRFNVTSTPEGDDVITAPLEPGLDLRATSAARTVVDLARFRCEVGERLAAEALRRFLDRGDDLEAAERLARRTRASSPFTRTLRLAHHLGALPPVRDARPLVYPSGFSEDVPPFFRR